MTRLIDADEMLKRLESWNTDDEMDKALYNFTLSRIIEQPTVDAVPVRHGKWKKIRGTINCSACKSCSWSMSFEDLVMSFNYCPNCGAKMDGDKHGTD